MLFESEKIGVNTFPVELSFWAAGGEMPTITLEFLLSTKKKKFEEVQEDVYFIKSAVWEEASWKDPKPTGKGSIFQYNCFLTIKALNSIVDNLLPLFQLTCPWHCRLTEC